MLDERHFKRLMAYVRKEPDGCWTWCGGLSRGYGVFHVNRKPFRVHRLIYRHYFGEIDDNLHVHHTCENRSCVNPDHLKAVTPMENNMASDTGCRRNSLKTHCPQGHPYDEENTYYYNNRRHCRKCLGMLQKNEKWKKNYCPQGHKLEGGNVYQYRGKRHCKECRRTQARESYRRKHGLSPA